MNSMELSNLEIADLCRELALLMHAGIGEAEGMYLMAEQSDTQTMGAMLTGMAKQLETGCFLADAFEQAGCFPVYITGLVKVGEAVGRTEEALLSLASYYENKERMQRQIISALTYPAILLVLMLVVIVILLSQVLPVFNDIYASLGGQLTGVAGGLLLLGQILDYGMPVLFGIMALAAAFFGIFYLHRGFRKKVLFFWNRKWGDKGIAKKINNARFARALSMGFSSGMQLEDAVEMAAELLKDSPGAQKRCALCCEQLVNGASLADALEQNALLTPVACRLLSLAIRSGNGDSIMEEIADRMQEDAQQALEAAVSKVEPALILVTSGLVGVILLSVMLPLMNIMSAIG